MKASRLKDIEAGDLRIRGSIQNSNLTDDGQGGQVTHWSDYVQVWLKCTSYRGYMQQWAGEIRKTATHTIIIRFQHVPLDASMRMRFQDPVRGERIFNIVYVLDIDEEHQFQEIYCTENSIASTPIPT